MSQVSQNSTNQSILNGSIHLFGALIMTILPTPQLKSNVLAVVLYFSKGWTFLSGLIQHLTAARARPVRVSGPSSSLGAW